jgi:hypothetical protein
VKIHIFTPSSNSTPFHALQKVETTLLATTLCGYTKPTMSTLELFQNGGADGLSTISSIHNISSIFRKFEQGFFKNNGKEKKNEKMNNLGL